MTKKATTTAAPAEEHIESEFTDLATLRKHFKLSYAAAMKVITDADFKPVHSQRVGKGVMSFYKRKEAFALFEAHAAAKKKALEEKAAGKDLEKHGGSVSPEALSAVFNAIATLAEKTSLQHDITAKQFEMLSIKLGAVEKHVGSQEKHPVITVEQITEAIKQASGDGGAGITKLLQQTREDSEIAFAGISQQLDSLLNRVDVLTNTVKVLEDTILSIVTAPTHAAAPVADNANKSGEANKAQDFFREGVGASFEELSQVPSAPSDKKAVSGEKARNNTGDVLSQGESVSKYVGKRDSVGEDLSENTVKPRVLILGLHDNKVRHIDSFKAKLDMTILNPDEATTRMNGTAPKADYVFEMVNFISHSIVNKIPEGPEHVMVKGGVTTLRRELNKIVKKN